MCFLFRSHLKFLRGDYLIRSRVAAACNFQHILSPFATGSDELSHAPVCQQHEFLDEPVRFLRDFLEHVHRTSGLIHKHLHLRALETDGSGSKSFLAQSGSQFMENEDSLFQILRNDLPLGDSFTHCSLATGRLAIRPSAKFGLHGLVTGIDDLLGGLISESVIGINYRAAEPLGHYPAQRSDFEHGGECQFLFIRPE